MIKNLIYAAAQGIMIPIVHEVLTGISCLSCVLFGKPDLVSGKHDEASKALKRAAVKARDTESAVAKRTIHHKNDAILGALVASYFEKDKEERSRLLGRAGRNLGQAAVKFATAAAVIVATAATGGMTIGAAAAFTGVAAAAAGAASSVACAKINGDNIEPANVLKAALIGGAAGAAAGAAKAAGPAQSAVKVTNSASSLFKTGVEIAPAVGITIAGVAVAEATACLKDQGSTAKHFEADTKPGKPHVGCAPGDTEYGRKDGKPETSVAESAVQYICKVVFSQALQAFDAVARTTKGAVKLVWPSLVGFTKTTITTMYHVVPLVLPSLKAFTETTNAAVNLVWSYSTHLTKVCASQFFAMIYVVALDRVVANRDCIALSVCVFMLVVSNFLLLRLFFIFVCVPVLIFLTVLEKRKP
ncbi:hypothetical protein HK405_005570 [Cladochytrium tenue]|nr:hypothetical protein HK405_005570 [Cladochytrium tenue]